MPVRDKIQGGILLLCVGLLVLYGTYGAVTVFFTRQVVSSPQSNTLCTGDEAPRICKTSGPLQFKKFLWFVTDGLPIKYSERLLSWFGPNGVVLGINVPGAKYSHAIYTSWLTGQLPTNYAGAAIKGDQLLKRMVTANFNLSYEGPEWSFLAINGKENYDALFKGGIKVRNEPLDGSVIHSYPFYFENSTTIKYFEFEVLQNLVQTNGSLITHSGVFDHINHGVFRHDGDIKHLDEHAVMLAEDIKPIKYFIDRNPDYLLILSSDHGIDANTPGGYVMHGQTENGNEGYLLFYNPNLTPHRSRGLIDVVDVAPTIAKYLQGVDIPFNSVGMARNYYGEDSTALKLQSNVLKQNLIQLQNCTVARKKEGISEEQISEYLLLKPSKENIFKIQQQLNKIKSQIYDVLDSPIDECYIINSVYIITLISFLSIFNFNWIFASPFNLNYLKNIFWLILIYFGPLIHVLFYKSFYKQAFSRGSTFFLPASLLGLLVLFFWRNQLFYFNKIKYLKTKKTENQNEHDDSFTTFSATSPPSLSDTVNMDYTNTFANFSTNILLFAQIITWIELAATLVFGAMWKSFITSLTYSKDFSYVLNILLFSWVMYKLCDYSNYFDPSKGKKKLFLSIEFWSGITIFGLFRYYEYSENEMDLYEFYGFHYYILAAVVIAVTVFLYTILRSGSLHILAFVVNFVIFLLWVDSSTGRLLNFLWNMKYLFGYLPLFEIAYFQFNILSKKYETSLKNGANSEESKLLRVQKSEIMLLIQTIIMLLMNQSFYHLSVTMGDGISMDLHPFSGKVGMKTYDGYPILAGFLMCFHKYGYLAIFVCYLFILASPSSNSFLFTSFNPFLPLKKIILDPSLAAFYKDSKKVPFWSLSYRSRTFFIFSGLLVFFLSGLSSYYLLLVFYTPDHAIEPSAIYTALLGTMNCCFIVFTILHYLLASFHYAVSSLFTSSTPPSSHIKTE